MNLLIPERLSLSEAALIQSICRESFEEFVKEFWNEIVPETLIWNWHMSYLCKELQEAAERVFRGKRKAHDVIFNVPPGTSKSTICSILFPAWVWTRMPTARFLGTSYSADIALELARKNRQVVRSEKYQVCFGPLEMREDQDVKSNFENQHGGARYASGASGTITGRHAHFLLVDDPLNPEEAASQTEIKNANRFMSETLPSRKIDKEISVTILIMQRLHQADPTGSLLEKAEVLKLNGVENPIRHIKLPATTEYDVKPTKLTRFYEEIEGIGYLDPIRCSPRVCKEAKVNLGESGYAGQFGQSPVPPGGAMFKVENFHYGIPPPLKEFVTLRKIIRSWDKAGTLADGDYTAGPLMGKDKLGRYWILDMVRGQWDTWTREEQIQKTAEMDGRDVYIRLAQDPGSAGKDSVAATVRMLAGYRCRVHRPTGSKEIRADAFSVQVNQGNVWVRQGAPWIYSMVEELRFFPFGLNDDQVDALADCFNFLSPVKVRTGGGW